MPYLMILFKNWMTMKTQGLGVLGVLKLIQENSVLRSLLVYEANTFSPKEFLSLTRARAHVQASNAYKHFVHYVQSRKDPIHIG